MTDSRNLRLRNSLGRYIARLDADDTLRPNVFADKVAILDANPDAVMVYEPTQCGSAGRAVVGGYTAEGGYLYEDNALNVKI